MSIIDDRNKAGILADDKKIYQDMRLAVAGVTGSTTLMSEMAPYLFDNIGDVFTPEYIIEVTTKFQEQIVLLREQMKILDAIEKLGSTDQVKVAEGRAILDPLNAVKPPLTDRYK